MTETLNFPRHLLMLSLIFSLAGCGFSPMYSGDRTQAQAICLTVKGDGYLAYKFRRELEKQLALMPHFNNHEYKLNINLAENKLAASYAEDATITRSQIMVTASYELKQNGQKYGQYTNQITTSYPVIVSDEFVTRNADNAASTRVAIALAEQVASDINRLLRTGGHNPK